METQDHKKLKQSGNEGHSGGGVHVCSKCGWPFPNAHPSSRHRRAHKKLCGTIEGYRLDTDAEDKTHLIESSDGEHVVDDEHKIPSVNVVERTISRRSNSGVGSRSSRSTRSEDEMFSDAVTDFTDTSAPGDGSDGGIQRFYSLQCVTESDLDDSKLAAENDVADNLCAPNSLLKDNHEQVQPLKNLESRNERCEEADILSQDQISCPPSCPALVPASITAVENEDEGETPDENKAFLVQEKSGLRRSLYDETNEEAPEDVSFLKAGDEEIPVPVSASETAKLTGLETIVSETSIECPQVVGHPVEVIDPAYGSSTRLSDVMEDHFSKSGANEDVYVLAVPDTLPLDRHPDIVVEDLDLKRGKSNPLKAPGTGLKTESVEYGIAHVAEEVHIDPTETSDSKKVYSEDDVLESVDVMEDKLVQNVGHNSMAEPNPVGELGQLPDIEASSADICEFRSEVVSDFKTANLDDTKFSCDEEVFVSPENVISESARSAAADIQDLTSNGAANTSDGVKYYTENVALQGTDDREVSESLLLAKHSIDDSPLQSLELSNIHDSSDAGNDGKRGVIETYLDGDEMTNRGKDNAGFNAETVPGCGLSAAGSRDGIHEPFELDRIHDHGKSDKMVNSEDEMVGHSLSMIESSGGCSGEEECVGEDGAILKIDNNPGSKMISSEASEVHVGAPCSLQSSTDLSNTCTKNSSEEASSVVVGDRNVKSHVSVSAADLLPDLSNQTESLRGHWGSVSVAVSDTPPANDTPLSNQTQASAAKDSASLELKPLTEIEHSDSITSVEPHMGIGSMEGISEIQTLEEQKEKGSVVHLDDPPHGGKRSEEIIAKVTNWSTDKQHTPLKTLLGEATARSRAESPIHPQMIPQTDEIPVENNGFSKTENVIFSSNKPTLDASKEEMGKDWNSPARYPVNMKTEKRKAKGKPYWAPFFCCSSVNAR